MGRTTGTGISCDTTLMLVTLRGRKLGRMPVAGPCARRLALTDTCALTACGEPRTRNGRKPSQVKNAPTSPFCMCVSCPCHSMRVNA